MHVDNAKNKNWQINFLSILVSTNQYRQRQRFFIWKKNTSTFFDRFLSDLGYKSMSLTQIIHQKLSKEKLLYFSQSKVIII
jgi:hypothetical protein